MTTEKICFRYDGSEDSKKCIEWINYNATLFYYKGRNGQYYCNDGNNLIDAQDSLKDYRLVTPAEFLRLVSEPQWKVGDECEFIDCGRYKGVIIAIKDNWIWVQGKDHPHPTTVGVDDLRHIRKSLRDEINDIVKDWLLSENQYDLVDRLIQAIKQRKDEL